MNCTFCGSEISEGSLFCSNCGAQVAAAGDAAMPQGAMPGQEAMPEQGQAAAPAYQPYQQQEYPGQGTPYQQQEYPGQGTPYQQPGYSNANVPGQQPAFAPASAGPVAGMPNTTVAIVLIVVGFLCGILWGIIGVVQYGPMKRAIEAGDVETAKKKFNIIMIATIIGLVLNVIIIASGALN